MKSLLVVSDDILEALSLKKFATNPFFKIAFTIKKIRMTVFLNSNTKFNFQDVNFRTYNI